MPPVTQVPSAAEEQLLREQLAAAWRDGREEAAIVSATQLATLLLSVSRARETCELCQCALARTLDFRLLHSLGRAQQFTDPAQAVSTFRQAIRLSADVGEESPAELRQERAALLFNCAQLCRGFRETREAIHWLTEAEAIVEAIGDADGRSAILAARAQRLGEQGNTGAALELYGQALLLDRRSGLSGSEPAVLLAMGQLHADSGQSAQAAEHYEQALAAARKEENPIHIAAVLRDIGTVYRNRGDAVRAVAHYAEALAIQQDPDIGDSAEAAATLLSRGYVHLAANNPALADEDFKTAERSLRARGRSALLAEVWKARGAAARVEGSLSKADHHLREALELESGLGLLTGKAVTLAQLGVLSGQAGSRATARTYGREAAQAFGRASRWPELFTVLENLSGGSDEPDRSMYSAQAVWVALRAEVDGARAFAAVDTLWRRHGADSELGPLLGAALGWWARVSPAGGELPAQLRAAAEMLSDDCCAVRGISADRKEAWMRRERLHDHAAFLPRLNVLLEASVRERDWVFDRSLAPPLPGP